MQIVANCNMFHIGDVNMPRGRPRKIVAGAETKHVSSEPAIGAEVTIPQPAYSRTNDRLLFVRIDTREPIPTCSGLKNSARVGATAEEIYRLAGEDFIHVRQFGGGDIWIPLSNITAMYPKT